MDDDREILRLFAEDVLEACRLYDRVHRDLDRAQLGRLIGQIERVRALATHHALPVTIPFVKGGGQ